MQLHGNARRADQARVNGLVRTRYTLDECVVCGHERVHTPQQETAALSVAVAPAGFRIGSGAQARRSSRRPISLLANTAALARVSAETASVAAR